MKKSLFRKVLCFVLSVTVLLSCMGFSVSAASLKDDPDAKHPYSVPSLEEMQSLVGTVTYNEYLADYGNKPAGPESILLNILNFTATTDKVTVVKDSKTVQDAMLEEPENWTSFGDNADKSVYLPSLGDVTWHFDVSSEQEGLYYIRIEYFSCITDESSVSAIVDFSKNKGKIPFSEAASITLKKDWQFSNISVVESDATGQDDMYDVKYEWAPNQDYLKIVTSIKDGKKTVTTYKLTADIIGNSMTPGSTAAADWNSYYIADETGYHVGNFAFFIPEGSNSITFEAERDPVIVKSIELVPANDIDNILSYDSYLGLYQDKTEYADPDSVITIEGEFPDFVSDASVAPSNDNTSAINKPAQSGSQIYNVIGETGYSAIGQWAAYKFRVTDTGFYNFGMRYKQNALQGMYVCRTLKLAGGEYGLADGTPTVPFKEAYDTQFNYVDGWQSSFLSDGSGTPFLFYFEEGVEYTLYLECSLGTLKKYIKLAEDALTKVNASYLRILQLTGTDPDEYNDSYDFAEVMPDVLITLLEQAVSLQTVHTELKELCGTNGSHIATLETIYNLLNKMGNDDGKEIAANLSTLKSYLGTLGTWINNSKASTVMVDSIVVAPMLKGEMGPVHNTAALPRAEANFFESLWFEVQAFFASFFIEYDNMGLTEVPDEDVAHISVWIAAGRDQSQIWRTMIDHEETGFTGLTGTAVALKLVTGSTLLPSILSRKGPDVYMGLGAADTINYAIRDAVLGVNGLDPRLDADENALFTTTRYTYKVGESEFETTTEYRGEENLSFTTLPYNKVVEGNFAQAAIDTITISPGQVLDENGDLIGLPAVTYGLPRTMQFSMMFYRMDVLANIGRTVPETWDDLLSILPVLQANNMQIGVSYIAALDFMIYQKGGSMWKYTDTSLYEDIYAGARVDLDSNIALEAFEFTCQLYSDYSFPISYDAANRFRTGEMPILIGSYADLYNQLVVYATELSGLWEFCSLPGSFREDGSFNYNSLASVTATILLNGCDTRGNLLPAWQFAQWETAEEQSADYGNRIVAIIGQSAKYETANLNSIDDLSWTASEKAAIMNQMDHMSSIVNYPGSYIINRYMQFAFLDAVNDDANAVDAMTSYIDAINSEIARKRQEFGLWVPASSDDEPPMKNVQD